MNIHSIPVTATGQAIANKLPFPCHHGKAAEHIQQAWNEVDGLVIIGALPIALRLTAPLLHDKQSDPAVVAVDDKGKFAIAMTGGHRHTKRLGSNYLAKLVAGILGAQPIITTSSELNETFPLDDVEGFKTTGDVSGLAQEMIKGANPVVDNRLSWPLPPEFPHGNGPGRLVVTDHIEPMEKLTVFWHPPSLVVGVGIASQATTAELIDFAESSLKSNNLTPYSVGAIATIDRKGAEPAVVGLANHFRVPIQLFSAEELDRQLVPTPNEQVRSFMGTASVAEAAALLAAGPHGELLVGKQTDIRATLAIARRKNPPGSVSVIGIGPGSPEQRSLSAIAAIKQANVVLGYAPYLTSIDDLLTPSQQIMAYQIGEEIHRVQHALSLARQGYHVALVSSGDPGVYGMASPLLEEAIRQEELSSTGVAISVVPGVTAALSAAAALGAPLASDYAVISLSDLLTPWEVIERRLQLASEADLTIVLYNPASKRRLWQLPRALEIIANHRHPSTPVGMATDISRPGERVHLTTLAELDISSVTMTTCIIVGSSNTFRAGKWMITRRGYPTETEQAGTTECLQ